MQKILITTGPTIEKIDDVRFISNFSSGKMGYAIAEEAFRLGFEVYLVSGPVCLKLDNDKIKLYNVESADEMYKKVMDLKDGVDVIIMSAAVSDYKPKNYYQGKLKKEDLDNNLSIELQKNVDILFELGKVKLKNQILVGFALESENGIENAKKKLISKNCDLIVLNLSNKLLSGFKGDFNTITLIDKKNQIIEFPPMTKHDCSKIIMNWILNEIKMFKEF